MLGGIGTEEVEMPDGSKRKGESFNPIYMMADSAREAVLSRSGNWQV